MPKLPDIDPAMLLSAAGQRELAAATATRPTKAPRGTTAREGLPQTSQMSDDAWVVSLETNYELEGIVESNEIQFDQVPLEVGVARLPERRNRFRVDRPPSPLSSPRPFQAEVHRGQSDGRVVGSVRQFRGMTPEQRATVMDPEPEQVQGAQEKAPSIAERHFKAQQHLAAEKRAAVERARKNLPTAYERLSEGDFLDRWDDFSK